MALFGGTRALVLSPFAQSSIGIAIICNIMPSGKFDPASTTLSVVPNILGFTVSALAIILALSSSEIFVHLTQKGNEDSLFMKTIANLLHFIIVQVLAIVSSFIYLAYDSFLLKYIVSSLMLYSVLTTLSTGIQLFQMAHIFNAQNRIKTRADPLAAMLNMGHSKKSPSDNMADNAD
ncbi:MAG: hypothetical protein WB816_04125 [Methylocystis sp.]